MKITKFEIALLAVTILTLVLLFSWNYRLSYNQITQLESKLNLFEMKADSVKLKPTDIQRLDLKIDKLEMELRKDYDLLLKVGLPASILALIGLFWGIYKTAYSFAIEEAKKEIEKAYKSEEALILSEKKILLLHKKGASTEEFRNFFIKLKFENFTVSDFDTFKDADKKDDLIFLLNDQASYLFDDNDINSILSEIKPSTIVFSYGKNFQVKDERLTSALFKSQVYGNLMNSLKYQKVLKP